MKSRNQLIKASVNTYYSKFYGQSSDLKQKEYCEKENDPINKATYPFKLSLNVEKNGFNYISVCYCDARTYIKNKEKNLMPLRVSQRFIPPIDMRPRLDFMLTSLKIIRISDSYLPPLIKNNSIPSTPKDVIKIHPTNNERTHLMSSSSAANE